MTLINKKIQNIITDNIFPNFTNPFTGFFKIPYYMRIFDTSLRAFDAESIIKDDLLRKLVLKYSYYVRFLTKESLAQIVQ